MRREETPSPPLLEVKELTVACQGKTVVRDICFPWKRKILGIVGESGSGKSTILKAVMGNPRRNIRSQREILIKETIFWS